MAGRGRLEVSTQGIAGCMAGAAFGQSGQIGGRIPFNGTPQLFEGCDLGTMESVGAAPEGKAVDPDAALGRKELSAVFPNRSDERRVGKECVSTFRSRWPPMNS